MIPVRFNFDFSRIVYLQRVSGRELANSREHHLLARDVTEGEILSECALVEFRLYARVGKNCLDLRAKNKLFVVIKIVERLDPEPITRDEEAPQAAIPDGESEHPTQMLQAVAAVLFIQMNNRFSIALGAITVAPRLELRAQFAVIVDFAVIDDPQALVLVADRLVTSADIDNAEAPHGQSNVAFDKEAVVVRPSVHDLRIHLRQRVALNAPFLSGIHNSADSTHISRSPFRSCRRHPRRFRNPPTSCAENHSPTTLRYQSTKYAFSR